MHTHTQDDAQYIAFQLALHIFMLHISTITYIYIYIYINVFYYSARKS
jgi:hypothetical protein